MVHWLLSTTRCKTFALIGRCLRRGVIILQRAVEILQRVVLVDWAVRPQRRGCGLVVLVWCGCGVDVVWLWCELVWVKVVTCEVVSHRKNFSNPKSKYR